MDKDADRGEKMNKCCENYGTKSCFSYCPECGTTLRYFASAEIGRKSEHSNKYEELKKAVKEKLESEWCEGHDNEWSDTLENKCLNCGKPIKPTQQGEKKECKNTLNIIVTGELKIKTD